MFFDPLSLKCLLIEAAKVLATEENDHYGAMHLLTHALKIQCYYSSERNDPNTPYHSAPIDTVVIETLMARSLFALRDYMNALYLSSNSYKYYSIEFGPKHALTCEAERLCYEIVHEMTSTRLNHALAA